MELLTAFREKSYLISRERHREVDQIMGTTTLPSKHLEGNSKMYFPCVKNALWSVFWRYQRLRSQNPVQIVTYFGYYPMG
jgi:hypothetical protein